SGTRSSPFLSLSSAWEPHDVPRVPESGWEGGHSFASRVPVKFRCQRAGIRTPPNASAARCRLGVPDDLVDEEDDVAFDGLGVDAAHRFLVAGLAEESLAGAERDREDLQP